MDFTAHHRRSMQSSSSSIDSHRSGSSSHSRSSSSLSDILGSSVLPSSKFIDLNVDEPCPTQCENVIFDLGDVLFTWSTVTTTSISPKVLKKILRSASWFEYEKGNLSEQQAYDAAAEEFKIPASEVARAFQDARDSLKSNQWLISLIKVLKFQYGVRVFAMSNISVSDFAVLRTKATAE